MSRSESHPIKQEGWRDFPEVADWHPFHPYLTVGLEVTSWQGPNDYFFEAYGTQNLYEAIGNLYRADRAVSYGCLPIHRVAEVERTVNPEEFGAPWPTTEPAQRFEWELDWPLMRRGKNRPIELDQSGSQLYSDSYNCDAYFRVYRADMWTDYMERGYEILRKGGLVMRLAVAGTTPEHCEHTWGLIAGWMRQQLKSMRD